MTARKIQNDSPASISLGRQQTQYKNRRMRMILSLAVSSSCTLIWLFIVIGFDLWERIADLWPATITMIFGSIVAGSTPQGGGVIAFPVFTKVFGMPPEIARTFSLCIQSVGMTVGSVWIAFSGKPVEWRAALVVTASASVGLLVTGIFATSAILPFRPALFSAPYVKVTFTIVLIAMAFVVYEVNRAQKRKARITLPAMNGRIFGILIMCGLLGGIITALVGSGVDVLLYLAVVLFLTVDPKVGVPTSVICMAAISILGGIQFAILDGQFMVVLDSVGNVTSLNGHSVTFQNGRLVYGYGPGAPAEKYDVLGLWLACVPVVVWGAPLGTWFATQLSSRNLVGFVTLLALLEGLSTIIFLKPLRTDMILLTYFVIGSVLTISFLRFIASRREQIFHLE